jgi:hypothetical protein
MAPRTRGVAAKTARNIETTAAPEAATASTVEATPIATAPKANAPEAANPDTGEEAAPEKGYELALALPPHPGKPSAAFLGLACLPTLRRPELRPTHGVLNLARIGNREAILAQSVGAPAPSPCSFCAKDGGPWTSCMVVDGFFRDSCANCHFGGCSIKCTLHQTGK